MKENPSHQPTEPPCINPYFNLFHGKRELLSTIKRTTPFAVPLVKELINKGDFIGQHTLPFDGQNDMLVWYNKRQEED